MSDMLASDASMGLRQFGDELFNMDFGPVFESLIDPVHEGVAENFDATRSPSGKWPPHSPVTIMLHGPHPLLVLSGTMKAAVTSRGSSGRIEEFTRDSLTFGTDLFYAPYQQYGTRKIPARPFLWLEGSYVDRITDMFADGVLQRLGD
jgi:phage gpG-like protein